MPIINLKNPTIKKLEDKNFNTYFLIIDNDNPVEVYFCFQAVVKSGWDNLKNN